MSEIAIRPATRSDEPALGRYGAALMRLHHELDARRFILTEHPEAGYGRFLVSQIDDPETVVLVAEQDGAVVGYVYAGLEPMDWMQLRAPCGAVYDVFVDPAARGRGIGEHLMRAAIDWLAGRGQPRVVLSSAEGNDAAQRLFARLGFRRTMVEMTRELEPPVRGA